MSKNNLSSSKKLHLGLTTFSDGAKRIAFRLRKGKIAEGTTLEINCIDKLDFHYLARALASPKCNPNLTLVLRRNYIDDSDIELLTDMLANIHANNLTLDLKYNWITDKGAEKIIQALVQNTECNIIVSAQEMPLSNNNKRTLELLYQRNLLLRQYPKFSALIKAACYQAGLYDAGNKTFNVPSLFYLCGKQTQSFYKALPQNTLPKEIKEYLDILKEIKNRLKQNNITIELPNFSLEEGNNNCFDDKPSDSKFPRLEAMSQFN